MSNRWFVIVEPVQWYCGVGCLMGILNYFFMTSFWTKDTFDIATLAKFWEFDFQNNYNVDDYNIAYFLAKMNFKISLFSSLLGSFEDFWKDPIAFFKKNNINYYPEINLDDSVNVYKKMKSEKNITFIENEKFDIFELIKHKQNRSTLFLLGGDYYVLRWEKRPEGVNHSGHFVVCSWIKEEKFIIHDPGPDIKMEYLVEKETLYKAIKYYGWDLYCIMIEYV